MNILKSRGNGPKTIHKRDYFLNVSCNWFIEESQFKADTNKTFFAQLALSTTLCQIPSFPIL